jgi:hypothetical protein
MLQPYNTIMTNRNNKTISRQVGYTGLWLGTSHSDTSTNVGMQLFFSCVWVLKSPQQWRNINTHLLRNYKGTQNWIITLVLLSLVRVNLDVVFDNSIDHLRIVARSTHGDTHKKITVTTEHIVFSVFTRRFLVTGFNTVRLRPYCLVHIPQLH